MVSQNWPYDPELPIHRDCKNPTKAKAQLRLKQQIAEEKEKKDEEKKEKEKKDQEKKAKEKAKEKAVKTVDQATSKKRQPKQTQSTNRGSKANEIEESISPRKTRQTKKAADIQLSSVAQIAKVSSAASFPPF